MIWWVTPSSQFIKSSAKAQQADAQALKQYLGNVLKTSNATYAAALKSDRVPIQGDADLAIWWEVRLQSTSTTNTLMSFQIFEFRILNLGSLGQGPIGGVQRATLCPGRAGQPPLLLEDGRYAPGLAARSGDLDLRRWPRGPVFQVPADRLNGQAAHRRRESQVGR